MNELDKKRLESAKIIRDQDGDCEGVRCANCFAEGGKYGYFCGLNISSSSFNQKYGAIAYIAEHDPEEAPVESESTPESVARSNAAVKTPLKALPDLSDANIAIDERIVEMVETEQPLTPEAVNEYNFFSFLLNRRSEVSA